MFDRYFVGIVSLFLLIDDVHYPNEMTGDDGLVMMVYHNLGRT